MKTIKDLSLIAVEESPGNVGVYNKRWRKLAEFIDNLEGSESVTCFPVDSNYQELSLLWSDPQVFAKITLWLEDYVKHRQEVMYGKW